MKLLKRFGFGLVILLLAACTEIDDSITTTVAPTAEEIIASQEAEAAKKEAEEKALAQAEAQQSVLEQEMLAIYQQNMPMVSVTFDAEYKAYMMIPTDEALIAEIYATLTGALDISHWDNLVSTFITVSASQQQALGNGYKISLQNPANSENTILILVDGQVFYNAFNE